MKDWQFRKVPINAVFITTTGLWSDTCLALQRTHVLFFAQWQNLLRDIISYFLNVKHSSIVANEIDIKVSPKSAIFRQ